jgi:hypothetical protein
MKLKLAVVFAVLVFASIVHADSVFTVTDTNGLLLDLPNYADNFSLSFDWDATSNTFYDFNLSITNSSGAPIPFTFSSILYADVVPPSVTGSGSTNGGLVLLDILSTQGGLFQIDQNSYAFPPIPAVAGTYDDVGMGLALNYAADPNNPDFLLADNTVTLADPPPVGAPEPSAWAMLALGLLGVAAFARLRVRMATSSV